MQYSCVQSTGKDVLHRVLAIGAEDKLFLERSVVQLTLGHMFTLLK